MAQLNLEGSSAATILQANNSITANQTFTFPSAGGELVTVGGSTNTGSGGTGGSGQIVGYQQGAWTPDFSQGTATTIRCNWYRIGNAVTFYGQAGSFTSSAAEAIQIDGLPYPNASECICGSVMARDFSEGLNGQPFTASYISSASIISFYSVSSGVWNQASYSEMSSQADFFIYWNGTYLTDNTDWNPQKGATLS